MVSPETPVPGIGRSRIVVEQPVAAASTPTRRRGRRDAPDAVRPHQLPPQRVGADQRADRRRQLVADLLAGPAQRREDHRVEGDRDPVADLSALEVLQGERQTRRISVEVPLLLEDGLHQPGRPVERLDDLGPVVDGELGDDGHRVVERAERRSGSSRARRPAGRLPSRPGG